MVNGVMNTPPRNNNNIDILKGMLVVLMLVYHCASMAKCEFPEFNYITQRISFLHSAFLIITGYICKKFYFPKIDTGLKKVKLRLYQRAVKVFMLFAVSNVILYTVLPVFNFEQLFTVLTTKGGLMDSFILSMNGRLVAFEVLYYISLFLLIVGLFIKQLNPAVVTVSILVCIFASTISYTAFFIGVGLIGYLYESIQKNYFYKKASQAIGQFKWFVPFLLVLYLIKQPLVLTWLNDYKYLKLLFVTLETGLWLFSFSLIMNLIKTSAFYSFVSLLGNYSLISYMAQMLFIRVGYMILSRFGIGGYPYYFINLSLTLIFLHFFILTIDSMRTKSTVIDQTYLFAFK